MLKRFDEDSLAYIATYFNKKMVSLVPLSRKQDAKFIKRIRKQALDRIGQKRIRGDRKLFYVGCVDFMVTESNGLREFAILEANGGSSRGLLSLAPGQTEMVFNAYKEAVDKSKEDDDQRQVILIGTVPNDMLFQEKIMLIEFMKERYEIEGYKVGVYNSFNFEKDDSKEDDYVFIVTNYSNLLDHLTYKNDHVIFKGEEVDVLIGDGVARRFPIISAYAKHDWTRIKTTIINPIYQITDDKGNTYHAVEECYDTLKKYRVKKLQYGKADDPFNLEQILERIVQNADKNYIMKPFGGSGGVGIQPISPAFSNDSITEIMEKSVSEFYQKFDAYRNPYPYTVQEMADFALIDWENSKRTFDLRIYVVQRDGVLYPVGGEGRVAKLPYTGTLRKEEFVVNISGFGGIDIERVIPFSKEGLQLLNISEDDLSDMFCAACELFYSIIDKYDELVVFNDWNQFLNKC